MKNSASGHLRLRARGFTLIELMITVAVIGILAAIAVPSYSQYVQRSHRANAKAAITQAAQWIERAATAQGNYPADTAPGGGLPGGFRNVEGGRYILTYVSPVGAVPGTYLLTASPSVPAQANDACGGFTYTQSGARGVTGTLTVQECWSR